MDEQTRREMLESIKELKAQNPNVMGTGDAWNFIKNRQRRRDIARLAQHVFESDTELAPRVPQGFLHDLEVCAENWDCYITRVVNESMWDLGVSKEALVVLGSLLVDNAGQMDALFAGYRAVCDVIYEDLKIGSRSVQEESDWKYECLAYGTSLTGLVLESFAALFNATQNPEIERAFKIKWPVSSLDLYSGCMKYLRQGYDEFGDDELVPPAEVVLAGDIARLPSVEGEVKNVEAVSFDYFRAYSRLMDERIDHRSEPQQQILSLYLSCKGERVDSFSRAVLAVDAESSDESSKLELASENLVQLIEVEAPKVIMDAHKNHMERLRTNIGALKYIRQQLHRHRTWVEAYLK